MMDALRSDGISCICGASNALIAKLVENAGFDGVWLSSFELHAWHRLPDAGILSPGDYSAAILSIADRIQIPILVRVFPKNEIGQRIAGDCSRRFPVGRNGDGDKVGTPVK